MTSERALACPNGCTDGRFEALNAPLYVDMRGRYLSHDSSRATYVCAVCQSVSVDVAAAAREMRRHMPEEAALTLRCPGCAAQMLPPEDDPLAPELECPRCGIRFAFEEGLTRLHATAAEIVLDDDIEVEE